MLARRHVPSCTPTAPNANAARSCLPSAIPPAAITGIDTESTTLGTRAIVVISPTCPPLSVPSATTASAPHCSILFARIELETTGITISPCSFHKGMNCAGLPAPVVTILTPSSTIISAICGASGFISIRFTPNGLSVKVLHFLIFSLSISVFIPPAPISPNPPALLTAAANSPVAIFAIPPCINGYLIPSILSSLILFSYSNES